MTAFGDIVTFEEDQYIGMVKYKNGNFVMLAKNFKRFIQNLGDDYFLEKYLMRPNLRDPIKHILRDLNKIMGILWKKTFFVIGKDQPVVDQ